MYYYREDHSILQNSKIIILFATIKKQPNYITSRVTCDVGTCYAMQDGHAWIINLFNAAHDA